MGCIRAKRPVPTGRMSSVPASVNTVEPVCIKLYYVRLPDIGIVVPELDTGIDHDLETPVVFRVSREPHRAEFDGIENEVLITCTHTRTDTVVQVGFVDRSALRR